MGVYGLKLPREQRLRHLLQQTQPLRSFRVLHPLDSSWATKNGGNSRGWRNWDPPVWFHRWLPQEGQQVVKVTPTQNKPSAFSGRTLPRGLRLKNAHF